MQSGIVLARPLLLIKGTVASPLRRKRRDYSTSPRRNFELKIQLVTGSYPKASLNASITHEDVCARSAPSFPFPCEHASHKYGTRLFGQEKVWGDRVSRISD